MDATAPISPEELEELREAFSKIGKRTEVSSIISSCGFDSGRSSKGPVRQLSSKQTTLYFL